MFHFQDILSKFKRLDLSGLKARIPRFNIKLPRLHLRIPHLQLRIPHPSFHFPAPSGKFAALICSLRRLCRLLAYAFILAVLVVAAGIGSIFYFITPERVGSTLESAARDCFDATVSLEGELALTRFPILSVSLPKTTLKRGDAVLARFDEARFELSHWALPLGAIRVTDAQVDRLETSVALPRLSTEALFEAMLSSGIFPKSLRVLNFRLTNAAIHIALQASREQCELRDLALTLQQLSPDMETPFDLQSKFRLADSPDRTGSMSATGTVTLKTAKKLLMFDNIRLSANLGDAGELGALVASVDHARIEPSEIIATNTQATFSNPQNKDRSVVFAAIDTRLVPTGFMSPEMRLDLSERFASGALQLQAKSAVDFQFATQHLSLDNLRTSIGLTTSAAPENPLHASLSGSMQVDCSKLATELVLAGDIGKDPLTFNGTLTLAPKPTLKGDLMLASFDVTKLAMLSDSDWLSRFDFVGDLRIGQFFLGAVPATQLHGKLQLTGGKTDLTDTILNIADGRLIGECHLAENASWSAKTQVDSVNLEKLFSSLAPKSPFGGLASGEASVTGQGLRVENVRGSADLKLLRSHLRGIDFETVHARIVDATLKNPPERADAKIRFDEGRAQCTMEANRLAITPVSVRNAGLKLTGEMALQLTTGAVDGKFKAAFAPTKAQPAVAIASTLTGKLDAPAWHFDYATAQADLQRAYGPKGAPSDKKSIWKSIRNLLKF